MLLFSAVFCMVGAVHEFDCSLVYFIVFVHPLSHTRNNGHVSFGLQSIQYKTQLTIYGPVGLLAGRGLCLSKSVTTEPSIRTGTTLPLSL
jgi:hypothetical protein